MVRSYPSVVRFSQLGELNSSLGGVKTKVYARGHLFKAHRVLWERLLNTSEVEALVNCTEFK